MSIEREKILSQLEKLKEKATTLLDERDKLVQESEELRTARREAEEKTWNLQEKLEQTEEELNSVRSELERTEQALESKKAELEEKTEKISTLESEKENEISAIIEERDELRAEMDQITDRLQRVSELYRETTAEKEKLEEKVDVSDLLSIYITLIETVFGGKPHARVLYTLHNTGASITRKHIVDSTGIVPALATKAIHDLRNENLVEYDEETQEVTLVKDIFGN
ncbi:hypothetical protein EU537_08385 [Candidatus Thorarchaeota archaeon]|nr:MAG: hypothetical protein EU537_08385 [Candidatus Thorarchaeota archaeon]